MGWKWRFWCCPALTSIVPGTHAQPPLSPTSKRLAGRPPPALTSTVLPGKRKCSLSENSTMSGSRIMNFTITGILNAFSITSVPFLRVEFSGRRTAAEHYACVPPLLTFTHTHPATLQFLKYIFPFQVSHNFTASVPRR